MTMLRIFLHYQMNRDRMNFGEGDGYYVGQTVTDFFNEVCKGTRFKDGSDYFVVSTRPPIGPRDLVCYILETRDQSIVKARTGQPTTAKGATIWSPNDHAMISEVYMNLLGTYDDRFDQLAVCIIHELMHNKLDTHPSRHVFRDIHNIRGGVVSRAQPNASSSPSSEDIKAMRKGIDLQINQYTGAIPP